MGALGACPGGAHVLGEGLVVLLVDVFRPSHQVSAGGGGAGGLHSRPLQELLLLLLPVRVHQLLWHQLHQLQALLDLHQDLKVLSAPHLSTDRRTLCTGPWGASGEPQVATKHLLSRSSLVTSSPGAGLGHSEHPPLPYPWGSTHSGCWGGGTQHI